MAVLASIIFSAPSHAPIVDLVSQAEDEPVEALHEVAAVLEHFDYPAAPADRETAEKSVAALLAVVTGLSQACWREGVGKLFQATEEWLTARGLS